MLDKERKVFPNRSSSVNKIGGFDNTLEPMEEKYKTKG